MRTLTLDGQSLTFDDLRAVLRDYPPGRSVRLKLSPAALRRVKRSRAIVEKALRDGRVLYGVNTGFGKLAETVVDAESIEKLQRNLILSHCVGMGPAAAPQVAALLLVLRANSLVRGYSGVSVDLLEMLVEMFNRSVVPVIPEVGSVGASGDLAPLASLGAVMLGEGHALHLRSGKSEIEHRTEAARVLKAAGLKPYRFKAKEAISLINGVQLTSAILAEATAAAEEALKLADIAGAMSLEALKGSLKPFDARIHAVRAHAGQAQVARNFRAMLTRSEVLESHRNCKKVQDAYSLRCIPQVHGAARDALASAKSVLMIEANSVTDNPLVFENGDILSGGNFHGQPLALAGDHLTTALVSLANISERRIERMTNPDLSELPAFLVADSGVNSGFMMVQVLAAALAAEARTLAAPASVQSIPTGGAKEDHVSMSPLAVRRCREVLDLVRSVLGLEILCAAQGLDFLEPLKPGGGVRAAHDRVRGEIRFVDHDRFLQPDIARATSPGLLSEVIAAVEKEIGALA